MAIKTKPASNNEFNDDITLRFKRLSRVSGVCTYIVIIGCMSGFAWMIVPVLMGYQLELTTTFFTLDQSTYVGRLWVMITLFFGSLIFWLLALTRINKERARIRREAATRLMSSTKTLTAEEFLTIRPFGARDIAAPAEFTGVYLLHNTTKDMYYVGQSVSVMKRVTQHLTGSGNGDVYADYKNGDSFTVQAISLTNSGYQSINDLERDMIEAHDAYMKGYNKTRGNRA